jgi:hypothetical protein
MPKLLNILDGESVEEFDALSASLKSEFEPATETERMLVEMMIQHEWLMRRALRMQQLLDDSAGEAPPDPKRLKLVVRYFKTHERGYAQAKRELENLRKNRSKAQAAARSTRLPVVTAESRGDQRQWEQILRKMPTLTNWVN